jgi:hypothetical protein
MRIVRSSSLAMAGATLAIALSVTAISASAASTFLLQFGTHQTESEARSEWDNLQSQYPSLLGNMNVRISPVGGEFRTQASGVSSRENAQKTCNSLAANNVQCLVVETSMYAPAASANDANYAPIAAVEENITVEMSDDGMDGVTYEDDALLAPQPNFAAAKPQPVAAPQEKTLRETLLPWLSFGNDEEEETVENTNPQPVAQQAPAPAPQPAAAQEAATPRPERVERSAWPEVVDRTAAAQMSESLPAQPELKHGETRVIPSRAPRPLRLPENETMSQFEQAVTPQQMPATPEPQAVVGEAQVEIAEAIQVPLSFGDAAPVPVNKPVGYGGFPSQPLPARALWVQMSNFANKEAAMNYWRQLSAQNPEMMRLLRVRVITPWRTPGTGLQRPSSLRMGPFTDRNEINRICSVAAQSKLRCTMVQETGSTATANVTRTPRNIENHNRRLAQSRTYSRTAGAPATGMYWMQLGAFNSVAEAQQRWDALKVTHNDVLGRLQPQISYPALSSSPTPVYHLRTGPFVNKTSAINNCSALQNRHVGCVVVQSR